MTMKKSIFILLTTFSIAFLLVGCSARQAPTQQGPDNQQPEELEIQKKFNDKIVYTTNQDQNISRYRADCSQRGGSFDECGTVCAPGADMCAQVCAWTCDLDSGQQNTTINQEMSTEELSSLEIARQWIRENSPTYRQSNGFNLTMINRKSLSCERCYQFSFSYLSEAEGVGSGIDDDGKDDFRDGIVETKHFVEIQVKNNTVTSAITDGEYDALEGTYIIPY